MPRYDHLLFDADETLFDFRAAERAALLRTLEHFALPADEGTLARYSRLNQSLWDKLDRGEIERSFLVRERFDLLLRSLGAAGDGAELNEYFLRRLGECPQLLPGAEALCRALAPRFTLSIVTNGMSHAQRGRFDRSPLRSLIPHLFISEELGCQKPQRAFLDKVLAALSVTDRRRVLVIGDSLAADIRGARNAELDSVWYNPAGLPPDPDCPPTYTIFHLDQLTFLLD